MEEISSHKLIGGNSLILHRPSNTPHPANFRGATLVESVMSPWTRGPVKDGYTPHNSVTREGMIADSSLLPVPPSLRESEVHVEAPAASIIRP